MVTLSSFSLLNSNTSVLLAVTDIAKTEMAPFLKQDIQRHNIYLDLKLDEYVAFHQSLNSGCERFAIHTMVVKVQCSEAEPKLSRVIDSSKILMSGLGLCHGVDLEGRIDEKASKWESYEIHSCFRFVLSFIVVVVYYFGVFVPYKL